MSVALIAPLALPDGRTIHQHGGVVSVLPFACAGRIDAHLNAHRYALMAGYASAHPAHTAAERLAYQIRAQSALNTLHAENPVAANGRVIEAHLRSGGVSGRKLKRQARFADSARSEQCEQATGRVAENPSELGELDVAADERGRQGRQAAGELLVAAQAGS
jgi:hypothetical protein